MAVREGYARLNPDQSLEALPKGQARALEVIDRRQFLIRLGGATATITVASTVLGSLLAGAARRELEEELAASMAHPVPGKRKGAVP